MNGIDSSYPSPHHHTPPFSFPLLASCSTGAKRLLSLEGLLFFPSSVALFSVALQKSKGGDGGGRKPPYRVFVIDSPIGFPGFALWRRVLPAVSPSPQPINSQISVTSLFAVVLPLLWCSETNTSITHHTSLGPACRAALLLRAFTSRACRFVSFLFPLSQSPPHCRALPPFRLLPPHSERIGGKKKKSKRQKKEITYAGRWLSYQDFNPPCLLL